MSRALVIAEPGCTHEGQKALLLQLLQAAHTAGADCFKPQWTSQPREMCDRRHIGAFHEKRSYYERAYGWLAFPLEWHAEFRDRCDRLKMRYACSVFLPQDIATVAPYVHYLKISSFESLDASMFQAAVALEREDLPILVSTGTQGARMMWWERWRDLDLRRLHCVSAYPAPLESLNLRAVRDLDGYSDHSRHLWAGALAVSQGAEFIEAHYRLIDCHPKNPDYAVSFAPGEFAQYIANIREAESMLGDGHKKRQPCEEWATAFRVVS